VADPSSAVRRTGSGIRLRTTLIAVLAVGLSLAVAGSALILLVRASLRESVETDAEVRARSIVRELSAGGTFTPGDPEEEFVQIVDADGSVADSSANVQGRPAIVSIRAGQRTVLDEAPIPDGPVLVLGLDATVRGDRVTLVLGRSLETVSEATRAIVGVLAVTIPALLLMVGGLTWILVGRVLSPVEAIRREVDAISSTELHRRVPDPPGHDEIARLAATMNAMLARLEEGHRRERRLVSDASHELRSPISSIRQHAEVALSHPEASTVSELAATILDEDARLQRIVDDLLLLSSLDEGSLRLRSEPVDLDDIVFEEAKRLRVSTPLVIDTASVSGGRVIGDRTKLDRLVRNLTENAARHARAAVRLSLREADGRVVFAVEDDGPGVPVAERDRIFERFVRLDDARARDSGGSGLGLSIVHDLAIAHGATVAVSDGDPGGARFEVSFPAADLPTAEVTRPTPFSEGSGSAPQDGIGPGDEPVLESRRER
jgi:signal transduction histidine kinase